VLPAAAPGRICARRRCGLRSVVESTGAKR
jgi:hypothetical protein